MTAAEAKEMGFDVSQEFGLLWKFQSSKNRVVYNQYIKQLLIVSDANKVVFNNPSPSKVRALIAAFEME